LEDYAFKNPKSLRLFEFLKDAYVKDDEVLRVPLDRCGWRSLVQIAQGTGFAPNTLYGKKPGQVDADLQDLITNGLVEMRYFEGERGRGGEVMRFRIADPRNQLQGGRKLQSHLEKVEQPIQFTNSYVQKQENPILELGRHLAAIMFTDMVSYTTLGQMNEALSIALVEEQRKIIRPILDRHNGREVKTMGDAFLVEFESALDAVRCAYDIQRAIREFNISLAEDRRVHLRVGVHLGDVISSDRDISGDAVNVASRIESFAEIDGVCLSRQVYDHIQNKFDLPLKSLGTVQLKNVLSPVEIFRMVMPWTQESTSLTSTSNAHESRRIAVLPFSNVSFDSKDEYFADGLTEELIEKLSQVEGLEVIARTSVMTYKRKDKKISEIGKELRTSTLIEGSVRMVDNRIRVTVSLVDANSERHLWSSSYDKNLDDIFAIQSDIATKVVEAMPANLHLRELPATAGRDTNNIIAYSEFLRARELLHETAENKIREALNLFDSAIKKDPNFARAYVGKAYCYKSLGLYAHISYLQAIKNARASIEKALAINDGLAEAHAALAEIESMEDNLLASEAEARKAIEINPNLAEAYSILASNKSGFGEIEESIKLREKAYQLDPLEPFNLTSLGDEYFWTGRDSDALNIWETSVRLAPYITHDSMMGYYISKGMYNKAEETIHLLQKLEPSNPENDFWMGYLAAIRGDSEKAKQIIKRLNELSEEGSVTINGIGIIYYALGDLDSFFKQMMKSKEAHTITIDILRYSPLVARARDDPRMQQLLEDYTKNK
jgi:adenylate cyclase